MFGFPSCSGKKKKRKSNKYGKRGIRPEKPNAHLEAIPATTIWKCLVVILSHIPKSNESWEICRQDKRALFHKNLDKSIKSLPQQESYCFGLLRFHFLGIYLYFLGAYIITLSLVRYRGNNNGKLHLNRTIFHVLHHVTVSKNTHLYDCFPESSSTSVLSLFTLCMLQICLWGGKEAQKEVKSTEMNQKWKIFEFLVNRNDFEDCSVLAQDIFFFFSYIL